MEQTSLNIGTIGQRLEAARQVKGVTVSEAGHATKILGKFIEAMESDDFGALSAPVYAKSFIRMYAEYLGLDSRPLVDEYIAQHAPKSKTQLTDEVRQNLAKSEVPYDGNLSEGSATATSGKKSIFSDVHDTISSLPSSGFPMKMILPIAGGILFVLIIVLSVTQCSDDEKDAPAPSGAASVERQLITDGVPDAYLIKPGVVEVEK